MNTHDKEECAAIVVKCFYAVYRELGHGFLEKNYENALAFELRERGLKVVQQARIEVFYKGHVIGEYFADLLVEDCLICELKAATYLSGDHELQLLNYLRATDIELDYCSTLVRNPKFRAKPTTTHVPKTKQHTTQTTRNYQEIPIN